MAILVVLGLFAHLVFFLQINWVMGQDALMKFRRGRRHRPTEEERVFMFLHLRGTTPITGRLGSRSTTS